MTRGHGFHHGVGHFRGRRSVRRVIKVEQQDAHRKIVQGTQKRKGLIGEEGKTKSGAIFQLRHCRWLGDRSLRLLTVIRGFLEDRRRGPLQFMRRRLLFRWLLGFPVSCVFVSHAQELATI